MLDLIIHSIVFRFYKLSLPCEGFTTDRPQESALTLYAGLKFVSIATVTTLILSATRMYQPWCYHYSQWRLQYALSPWVCMSGCRT